MIDWSASMQQTFEYYIVDPNTWKDTEPLRTVRSCNINRDYEAETLGSASLNVDEALGECYIRVYLIAIQNGVKDRRPLGTFIVQTPSSTFDGKVRNVTMDAYTPLIELKEKPTPLGYSVLKDDNIMDVVYRLTRENLRAPVVKTSCDTEVYSDFVANVDDTWMSFLTDLASNAKYSFDLDEMGRVLYSPYRKTEALQPVFTYTDDNSSILYSDMSMDHDLYGVPNVVEVVYSSGTAIYTVRVVNDDPDSQTSTVARGREILHRITDPGLSGISSEEQIEEYAKQQLESLSTVEYTVTYSHGYVENELGCSIRVGDCVRLNYTRAGLKDVKARVTKQTIECSSGCKVSETAVFTKKLWEG